MPIEKLTQEDGSSMDMVKENIDKLKEIFPDVFTEGKVDFDALQATLGEYLETNEESGTALTGMAKPKLAALLKHHPWERFALALKRVWIGITRRTCLLRVITLKC